MVISRSVAGTQISCGNSTIVVLDTLSDLGVTIIINSKWDSHILNKISKAYFTLLSLKRNLPKTLSKTTKIRLYNCYILSALLHASEVWHPSKASLFKLEFFQSRATKWFSHKSSYVERLRESRILPIILLLEMKDILF